MTSRYAGPCVDPCTVIVARSGVHRGEYVLRIKGGDPPPSSAKCVIGGNNPVLPNEVPTRPKPIGTFRAPGGPCRRALNFNPFEWGVWELFEAGCAVDVNELRSWSASWCTFSVKPIGYHFLVSTRKGN